MRINTSIGLCVILLAVLLTACSSTPVSQPIPTPSQPQPPAVSLPIPSTPPARSSIAPSPPTPTPSSLPWVGNSDRVIRAARAEILGLSTWPENIVLGVLDCFDWRTKNKGQFSWTDDYSGITATVQREVWRVDAENALANCSGLSGIPHGPKYDYAWSVTFYSDRRPILVEGLGNDRLITWLTEGPVPKPGSIRSLVPALVPVPIPTPVQGSMPVTTLPSDYDVEIVGNQGSWSTEPYPLAFNAGSRISVNLRAVDEDYTFTIDALGIDVEMPRGQTKTLEIDLPDEPILLVAYSRLHERDSFASAYISAGSPEFLDPVTRQPKRAFGLCEADHDQDCVVLVRIRVELSNRMVIQQYLSNNSDLKFRRGHNSGGYWQQGLPEVFDEVDDGIFEVSIDLRNHPGARETSAGGGRRLRGSITEPLDWGQMFGVRGTSFHSGGGSKLKVYMVADGGVPDDPNKPDTFVTLAGVRGSGRTKQVTMTETGSDTRQFESTLDYLVDLGAEVGDTVWLLHPQRQTGVEGGDVLDGIYEILPTAPASIPVPATPTPPPSGRN